MKHKLKHMIMAVLFTAYLFSCTRTVTPESLGLSSDTLKAAEQAMQTYIDDGKLAGISTMIIKNGVTIERANFGFADLEQQKAVNDSTIFRIFSMTKPITAVALMTLYEEGKFKLDDPVSKYIPEFNPLVSHFTEYSPIFL